MTIYIIRHGETTGYVENRYGGAYDDHLSEVGEAQACTLSEDLQGRGMQKIYASSLIRTQETAGIIREALDCPTEIVPDLRERNQYSFLSGMEKNEAREKYPEEVEMLNNYLNTLGGAESYDDFVQRFESAFQTVVDTTEHDTIALVTHGGPLRVLFRDVLKWGELAEINNCGWVCLERGENGVFVWKEAKGVVPEFEA